MDNSNVLVFGDVMLDTYITTDVNRISPEAPILVCKIRSQKNILGGAGNVAQNLISFFKNVNLVSTLGIDRVADEIEYICVKQKITPIFEKKVELKSTKKTRIISGGQQLLRLDEENYIIEDNTKFFRNILHKYSKNTDYIVISDYAKGAIDSPNRLITDAIKYDIKTIVDPKGTDFSIYRNCYILKPNEKEICKALNLNECYSKSSRLTIEEFRVENKIEHILVTLGKNGIMLFNAKHKGKIYPQISVSVSDVTGAGDTVCAGIIIGLVSGLKIEKICNFCNILARLSVQEVGNFILKTEDINQILKDFQKPKNNKNNKIVFTNGCFDILHLGHIDLLKECSRLGDKLIIGLNSDNSIKKIKGNNRPINSEVIRKATLETLPFVDLVYIFEEPTPLNLITSLKPDILVKGGDYLNQEIIGKSFVESYGGLVSIVPFKYKISTSQIIESVLSNEKKH